MINNKEYIIRNNIFNKGYKNKLCYVDVSRINIFVLLNLLCRTMIQKGGKDNIIQNRNKTEAIISNNNSHANAQDTNRIFI